MIPTKATLKKKTNLIKYLAFALNIAEEVATNIIIENRYILTLDYTLKMLQIHERQQNKMPTIISGETGYYNHSFSLYFLFKLF